MIKSVCSHPRRLTANTQHTPPPVPPVPLPATPRAVHAFTHATHAHARCLGVWGRGHTCWGCPVSTAPAASPYSSTPALRQHLQVVRLARHRLLRLCRVTRRLLGASRVAGALRLLRPRPRCRWTTRHLTPPPPPLQQPGTGRGAWRVKAFWRGNERVLSIVQFCACHFSCPSRRRCALRTMTRAFALSAAPCDAARRCRRRQQRAPGLSSPPDRSTHTLRQGRGRRRLSTYAAVDAPGKPGYSRKTVAMPRRRGQGPGQVPAQTRRCVFCTRLGATRDRSTLKSHAAPRHTASRTCGWWPAQQRRWPSA